MTTEPTHIICGLVCPELHDGKIRFAALMPPLRWLADCADPGQVRREMEAAARGAMALNEGDPCEHELRPVPYDPAGSDDQPCSACGGAGRHEGGCAWVRVWGTP